MDDGGEEFSAWSLIGQVGFIVLISLGIGFAIGIALDKAFHTTPWLTLVGVTIGFALGLAAVYRVATEATQRAEAAYKRRRKASGELAAPVRADDDDDDAAPPRHTVTRE